MLRYVLFVLFVALICSTGNASAGAAEKSTVAVGSYQTAAWNDRVCCKRGWQDWFTTRRACNRAGGHQVRNGQCRDDWNDRWDMRWFGWTGGDWNKRICCKRGHRDWWSTARECREQGGWEAPRRQCRNG